MNNYKAKRKLENSDDDEGILQQQSPKSQKTFTQHEAHWNTDGSLLLQIGDTRFKVHKSRLAAESQWFSALFSHQSGIALANDSSYTEHEEVLASVEVVDGLDLYFLDIKDAPSAEDFAVLLTAMNRGIHFVHNPPERKDVVRMYNACWFYEVTLYGVYCEKYILDLFPDNWSTARPMSILTLENAVQGVLLGSEYCNLSEILRPAFYDLIRAPIFQLDENAGDAASKARQAALRKLLETLPARHLVTLLDLQKRLVSVWSEILGILRYNCKTATCNKMHWARAEEVQKRLPYDPIQGIQIIHTMQFSAIYCEEAAKEVRRMLGLKSAGIWNDLRRWITLHNRLL